MNKRKVLVVEDEFLVSESICSILRSLNFEIVAVATHGLEAVELVKLLKPDVVLMDIGLPDISGIHATNKIFESCPVPVVILSAYDNNDMINKAMVAGAGAYLVKMPAPRQLEQAIILAMTRFYQRMGIKGHGIYNKNKVLIAEDEEIEALDAKNKLEHNGYNVIAVTSTGAKTIELAEMTRPDIIIMDIILKGTMDGIEAAEQIRSLFDTQIIFLTAYSDLNLHERAMAINPCSYLLKPVTEYELVAHVDRALYN